MEEKKYLKWYNKVGYGSGDLAANCIYGLVTSFVMIYLTDTVGLNSGVIGVLIAVARVFDGISDVIFGNLMDKTHTKMGKARPWMLWTQIGNCICLVLLFSVPMGMGQTAQYAYFFITYVLLNVIFYTANNIAYASLTSLITKNTNERVQMGSIRFMFSLGTNVVVSSVTVGLVSTLGGGAAGWRNVAIIYAVIALIVNTISVFSVKELSPEELSEGTTATMDEKIPFVESLKLLAKNKYFIMIAIFYVLMYRYRQRWCLLVYICVRRRRCAGYVYRSTDGTDDYRSGSYTVPGTEIQRYVESKLLRILRGNCFPCSVYRRRTDAEHSDDAGLLRNCRTVYQPGNRRYQRSDFFRIRVHRAYSGQTY